MSNLEDRGEASRFEVACPICGRGIVDTATGTAQHTPAKLQWIDCTCSICRRPFTFEAQRGTTVIPPRLPS